VKIAIGLLLGLGIGVVCRLAEIPLPAPPALVGALLVLAMTAGYLLTDRLAAHREARHRALCRGPSGVPAVHSQASDAGQGSAP
jgi:XapX domain-containing protein